MLAEDFRKALREDEARRGSKRPIPLRREGPDSDEHKPFSKHPPS
jgi:hypothetical protein